ncbi:hypothetical protein [Microbacterium sp. LBN7]|uniref:hypothetical protein n=1 Tax=Microbacterium sp. LBN7 TaxID=3129773 RepID=UPI0032526276
MDPRKELATLKSVMAQIVANAKTANRAPSVQEITELERMAAKDAHLQEMIDRTEKGVAILDRFRQGSDDDAVDTGAKASFLNVKATARSVAQKAIGTSADLVGVEFIRGLVPLDRPRTSLLQAIPAITRSSPVYEYLRQTVRTMNAGPVAEGALKPTSIVSMESVEAKLKVFAHISEPIPPYMLSVPAGRTMPRVTNQLTSAPTPRGTEVRMRPTMLSERFMLPAAMSCALRCSSSSVEPSRPGTSWRCTAPMAEPACAWSDCS